jgi:hypothetical protein
LVQAKIIDELFNGFTRQLEEKKLITYSGSIIDTRYVEVPRRRNSRAENKTIKEGGEPEQDAAESMRDFIIHANYERERIYSELRSMDAEISRLQELFKLVGYLNNRGSGLEYDHIPDCILNIRHNAWKMGFTNTLFEKLKNREFKKRFIGWSNPPVRQEEIEDRYVLEEKPETSAKIV